MRNHFLVTFTFPGQATDHRLLVSEAHRVATTVGHFTKSFRGFFFFLSIFCGRILKPTNKISKGGRVTGKFDKCAFHEFFVTVTGCH